MKAKKKKKTQAAPFVSRKAGDELDLTVRTFALRFDSINEKDRSIDATIATEKPVMVFDLRRWEPVEEILLMDGLILPESRQVPLLDSHDRSSVQKMLGSTRNLRVEKGELVGTNVFSEKRDAQDAFQLVREKHLTDNSIGYQVHRAVTIEPGKTKKIKGRSFTAGPVRARRITTSWEVKENSVLPIGGDASAKHRSEPDDGIAKRQLFYKRIRSMTFEKWLQTRGLKLEDLNEDTASALRADFDAEVTRSAITVNNGSSGDNSLTTQSGDDTNRQAAITEGMRAELDRQKKIRELGGTQVPDEVIQRAIDDSLTVEAAQGKFLEVMRAAISIAPGSPAIIVGAHEIGVREIEAGLMIRAGYDDNAELIKEFGEETANRADQLRDTSLEMVCRHALRIDGQEIPVGRHDMIRAAFSTTSLPIILGNVANKALLKGYAPKMATWNLWCNKGSASDFKTMTRARLTDAGQLELVNNAGEIKHGTTKEEYEQYNIATFAKLFSVTRTNIINDDLGVFTRMPQKMGVKARQKISQLVYLHLLANGAMSDGIALFHTTHKNRNTGAALAAATLAAALKGFYNQTDADGESIEVPPAYLLVPPSLADTGKKLLQSDFLMSKGSTDKLDFPTKNVNQGVVDLIVEPRLENTKYPGSATNDWYLTAEKSVMDTLEVAFLNGKSEPTIERFNQSPDVMGITYRVFIDSGVKSLDFRGLQKNEG